MKYNDVESREMETREASFALFIVSDSIRTILLLFFRFRSTVTTITTI